MHGRVRALVELARPHNMLAAAMFTAVGFTVAGGDEMRVLVLLSAATALVTGAGNVINDLFDVRADAVNKPSRPLPSGRLGRNDARGEYLAFSVLVIACALLLPRPVSLLVALWHVLLFLYAARLKRVLFLGNLLVAAVGSSAFLAGALAAGNPSSSSTPVAIAFAFVFSREIVKGGEDVEGDRSLGVSTVACRFGRPAAARCSAISMLVLAALLPVPAVVGTYGAGYAWVMELLVVPVLVIGAVMVVRHPEKRTFGRVSRMLKLGMFAGITAIALG